MSPKTQKKSKAPKEAKGSHHRAAQKENKEGFACPVCWIVPPTVRNDGVSTARHEPGSSGAARFRDTEFCNGQGQVGRYVLDKGWKPGHEPEASITAREFQEHGVERFEARQQARQEKAERKSAAGGRGKRGKAEAKPAKAGKAAGKGKARKPRAKAQPEAEEAQEPESAPEAEPEASESESAADEAESTEEEPSAA